MTVTDYFIYMPILFKLILSVLLPLPISQRIGVLTAFAQKTSGKSNEVGISDDAFKRLAANTLNGLSTQRAPSGRKPFMINDRAVDFCAGEEVYADELGFMDQNSALRPCHSLSEHFLTVSCNENHCLGTTSASAGSSAEITGNQSAVPGTLGIPGNIESVDGMMSISPQKNVSCTCAVLDCIECYGPRKFNRVYPCKRYSGYYFITALVYSVFLGLLAVDRFYLGYSAIAVGKLMTLGGFGIWWVLDVVLLVAGYMGPSDGSEWQPWNSKTEDYWPKFQAHHDEL